MNHLWGITKEKPTVLPLVTVDFVRAWFKTATDFDLVEKSSISKKRHVTKRFSFLSNEQYYNLMLEEHVEYWLEMILQEAKAEMIQSAHYLVYCTIGERRFDKCYTDVVVTFISKE